MVTRWIALSLVLLVYAPNLSSDTARLKPIRFDHGLPIVLRSGSDFLVLQFLREDRVSVRVDTEDTFRVRAQYEFKVFRDLESGGVSASEGRRELAEHYRFTDRINPETGRRGRYLHDIGSNEVIDVEPFRLQWSNGGDGKASWIYFGRSRDYQFVQQFRDILFSEIDEAFLSQYAEAVNIVPAITSLTDSRLFGYGDMVSGSGEVALRRSARIGSLRAENENVVLEFEDLLPGGQYRIERSLTVAQGAWEGVGLLESDAATASWTAPLDPVAKQQFFRIRAVGPSP